ncbi:MAG: glycosyltransferase family 4 protein [Lachnospiraceae bacterium]|nr:glycosyltransferase family 4 protein [Lachnospiraceae bacterium]
MDKEKVVYVFSDSHIFKYNDAYWCNNAIYSYDFWTRYLHVFDEVKIVSRVKQLDSLEGAKYNQVNGINVEVVEVPFMRGMKDYIMHYFELQKELKKGITDMKYAILRLPSVLSFIAMKKIKKTKCPYALEIVADPIDCYAGNALAVKLFKNLMIKACKEAPGVSYVTRYFLQSRYPVGKGANHFTNYYSSIDLDSDFYYMPRVYEKKVDTEFTIIHIANSINTDIKGHTTLLKTVKNLVQKGHKINCICVGGGDRVDYYKQMAVDLGIEKNVTFTGLLSSKMEIREYLLKSDIMVFPSQAEGLPRVLIEAMATGLPCVSTPVNGIPELLGEEYMFDPFDVDGFTECLERLVNNPNELTEMSSCNFEKAKEYGREILQERRNVFYRELLNYEQKR